MKKAFVLLLAVASMFAFAGCAAGYDSTTGYDGYGYDGYYNNYNTRYNNGYYNKGYNGTYDGNYTGYGTGYNTPTTNY